MAQFVTHIQPTLVEASQGHVPHHHGHQIGFSHSSHLPHSGHNMPSPPTHGNHHHGHQYATQHYSTAARREKGEHHYTSSDQHQHPQFYNINRHARHAYDHYTSGHQFANTGDGNTSFLRAARAGNLDKVLEYLKNNIDINTSNANGLNALHLASKDGHIHVVEELVKRGALVDSATKKGNTALHIASLAGQEGVVKLLIENHASVNVQSQNGFTPLYMAAQENHDKVVRLLLSNGANQSLATEDGFTPLAVAMQQGHDKVVAVLLESDTRGKVRLPALHIAAKKDDVKAANLLLENDHNPDVTSKSGFTPLHIASHYGNENIANLLIEKGADVNYAAKHNISPLHVAAKWGKANMVSLLLDKGANIESRTRDGLTPLHCAARSGHEQVVDMLLEKGAPISAKTKNGLAPLHMAAQGEHVDAARILLYHRAPVDEVTVDYLTALHVAAHCGHVRVAKLLLDRNADANARALNGFTPLHIACKKNRIKVVELLLRHGASISATTESGLTPLHVAAFMGCMNVVIYLLQHDASPDVPTVRGETPLHLAARANQTDIIRILLRNGAQVDARAREQQTPLHIASRLGNVDIVMLLLQHGAQVDSTTKDMYTALHIAAKEGQDEVAAVLIDNGAALDSTTKKGFTPLHLAAKYGHMKVVQLLTKKDAPIDSQGKNGVTPLHAACHYDHINVALLLLEKGASPHITAKNGHTALHIAAKRDQMDIATTLLEYGAEADAESKAGFTPLHLSAQAGHNDMSTLLLEHKAGVDHQAKNGLTPMHLCAQGDRVNVGEVLVKNNSNIEMTTNAGYTPLHVAAHFGQANMVRFLLQQGCNVDAATEAGYTPLHQAAQQGHSHIVNLLLENNADANAKTTNGQTAMFIAKKLGYISVLDSLESKTDESISPIQTHSDEKYKSVVPEAMQETFMSDSEEEGGEDTVLSDQPYRYLTVDEMKSLGDDSLPIDVTRDERVDSNRMTQSVESTGGQISEELLISPHRAQVHMTMQSKQHVDVLAYVADNIEKQHVGRKLSWKNFLVSFLVDARGGALRGCRHSGVRIIVPAGSAGQPTRVTCRYVKPQRTMHPPQLMEGEALASRVLELGPSNAKFLGPVVMEVPHFASLRGKEREIVILRSDNGETWKEHFIDNCEEVVQDVLNECFEPEEIAQLDDQGNGRICRFVTYDFPQYFAVVSRIRQEVHAIGPEGGMVSSTVVPQVQAVFPQGALTKKIKVGLQAQPIDPELTAKLLGRGVAVSPIVTVEPRRRKFHKAITLSMPAPKAHTQGMINNYSGNAPTLRLLCSITGGPSRAQWEDVTGSTPLTFVNDCVSFTTTVSARFWLMDCRNISEATKMATELYREAIHVPFMAKFVVFAKRVEQSEARLRVFCMTDDKEDKTLEKQEHFTEVAKSRDVEVLENKPQYIEMAGNLIPVTKSGDQLQLIFKAFRENRLPFNVRIKDQHADNVGRTLFMREPKVAKGDAPQQPICVLNLVLPEDIVPEHIMDNSERQEIISRLGLTSMCISRSYEPYHKQTIHRQTSSDDQQFIGDMRIVDVSNLLGDDWMCLAPEIGITPTEVSNIKAQNENSVAQQAQAMIQLFKVKKSNDQNILENGLKTIGREDIIRKCVTVRKRIHLDAPHETDNMKMSESVEELVRREDISRLQQLHEREEFKYSAEEKEVEESESDEEMHKRTVAERRQKIEKRLSIERTIPASTQKKEIRDEITEIKRKSLIEDKKAIHEEEILMQMPTDNSHKSSVVPEQVLKMKHSKMDGGDAVDKVEFDKELQDKFKKTVRLSDEEEDFIEEEQEPTSKIDMDSQDSEKLKEQKRSQIPVASKRSSQIFSEDGIKVKVIETEDPDLEDKLLKQKAKIEQEIDDDFVPKTYTEKPRESLTDAQFVKSVEATITKKMSEGRIEISDADIAKIQQDIPESQTPPPTPSEVLAQKEETVKTSSESQIASTRQFDEKLEDETSLEISKESGDQPVTSQSSSDKDLPKPTPRFIKASSEAQPEDTDFKQSKQFWQSLDTAQKPSGIPVPRPRIQLRISDSLKDESLDSSKHTSETSSDPQGEYSESAKEDDIDDESYPMEKSDLSKSLRDVEELEDDNEKPAQFYIGESSKNVIIRTPGDKRVEFSIESEDTFESDEVSIEEKRKTFASDAYGYEDTMDTNKAEEKREEFIIDDRKYTGSLDSALSAQKREDFVIDDRKYEETCDTKPSEIKREDFIIDDRKYEETLDSAQKREEFIFDEKHYEVTFDESTASEKRDVFAVDLKGFEQSFDSKQDEKRQDFSSDIKHFEQSFDSSLATEKREEFIIDDRKYEETCDTKPSEVKRDDFAIDDRKYEETLDTKQADDKRVDFKEDIKGYEATLDNKDLDILTFEGDLKDKSSEYSEETDDKSQKTHTSSGFTVGFQSIGDNMKSFGVARLEQESKMFRQGSETRNDILDDGKYEETKEDSKKIEMVSGVAKLTEEADKVTVAQALAHDIREDYKKDSLKTTTDTILQDDELIKVKDTEATKTHIKSLAEDNQVKEHTVGEIVDELSKATIKFEHSTVEDSRVTATQAAESQELKHEEFKTLDSGFEEHVSFSSVTQQTVTSEVKETKFQEIFSKHVASQDSSELLFEEQIQPIEQKVVIEEPVQHQVNITEVVSDKFAKFELALEKSELEASEKEPSKPFSTYSVTETDEDVLARTLDEVQESLGAVKDELIGVVKDGKLIKESPSEFEFKMLPTLKSSTEPIEEHHKEGVEEHQKEDVEETYDSLQRDASVDSKVDPSTSSLEEQDGVVHRVKREATDPLNRWSIPEIEQDMSSGGSPYKSFEKSDSRPLSSDIEHLLSQGGDSSDYRTALDATASAMQSTIYESAVSTLDYSGKTDSSMKSLDSDANLRSMELSEVSETLVPSIGEDDERELLQDDEDDIDFDNDEKFSGVLLEDYQDSDEAIPCHMKRSQEMIFKGGSVETPKLVDSPESTEKLGSSYNESDDLGKSVDDKSILSVSLSSTSNLDTVVENMEDMTGSLAGIEMQTFLTEELLGTSFERKTELVDEVIEEEAEDFPLEEPSITPPSDEPKKRGHKRNESSTDFMRSFGKSSSETTESSLDEEDVPLPELKAAPQEEKKESESESDQDPYETEYSRSFKSPNKQKKKKKETLDSEFDEKRPFTPSESVSEIIVEDVDTEEIEEQALEQHQERRPSQNMQDYSNVPNIMITEDQQKYSDDEDEEHEVADKFEDHGLYKMRTQEELNKTGDEEVRYTKEEELKFKQEEIRSEKEKYEILVKEQFEKKMEEIERIRREDGGPDSPDSFEMVEQPDISDEFVIIEEVGKEANEIDLGGKGIKIAPVKYVAQHDEEVEKIIVKSAPAAPNEGSKLYKDDIGFEFEDSPPTHPSIEDSDSSESTAAANKRWVEMQLAENHMRYPYDNVLEDIKEEENEFEVGSSRISSLKDSSFSSSTPEYDVLAGKKFFSRAEHDDVSMSSLQEFENLEAAISLENRKAHQGSTDSSNGSFTRRYVMRSGNGQGDDVSLSSLKEFEGLESACLEAHLLEIKAREEAASLLSRSDESNKSDKSGSGEAVRTTRTSTTTVISTEKLLTSDEIDSLIKAKLEECEENPMENSTDSLDLVLHRPKSEVKRDSEQESVDSLEINKSPDVMTSSIDSIEVSKCQVSTTRSSIDSLEHQMQDLPSRDSQDSLEIDQEAKTVRTEVINDGDTTTTITTTIVKGPTQTVTRTTTSTMSTSLNAPIHELIKDISSDSLTNLSTTSSATNATKEDFMSGSVTSCGSSTLIEDLDQPQYSSALVTTYTSSSTSSAVYSEHPQFTGGEAEPEIDEQKK